ncbi:MAG: DUF2141 domain-containing protein [Flavobacteriales bacterium]|nr:DUF2141 domain-containing protein [Flavobacteriales bacterium]
MRKFIILVISLLYFYNTEAVGDDAKMSICLEFDQIESLEGNLIIFLYQYENQFPMNPFMHMAVKKSTLATMGDQYLIENLPVGKYAVAVIDDQNSNNNLDFSWGVPEEGYGFSNMTDNVGLFSLPTFKRCALNCTKSKNTINLKLNY